jgi:fructose-1,6-bisphosphatase/inositol monophosphatase family enzyme
VEGVQGKIFGIGLSKTGTSSLAQALQRLGFKTRDCMGTRRYVAGDLSSIDMDTVLAHDALTDTPIPSFYRELDARLPGSKFILTVRDRESWLQSCRKQFTERAAAAQSDAHRRLFEDLYGTNVFDEQRFADGYERFVAGVHEYFRGRPADLLVLNVTAGDGWEKLCPFLGRPIPEAPFPKANVTQIRWIEIEELASIAEAAGRELLKHYTGPLAPKAEGSAGKGGALGLLRRVLHATAGADTTAAARASYKAIAAALGKRSPGIPIVQSGESAPPYRERRQWNHLWLVDPLDGLQAFEQGRGDFSVDVALVEDGVPIYGVVHVPARGVTYFGRAGKGAFRRRGGGPPSRLPAESHRASVQPGAGLSAECSPEAYSQALRVCEQLEAGTAADAELPAMPEWRAAAAHAVAAASGAWSLAGPSGTEAAYNSESLQIDGHRLCRKVTA